MILHNRDNPRFSLCRHFPAGFGALAAHVSADLGSLQFHVLTLVCTFLTDVSTQAGKLGIELGGPRAVARA